MNASEPEPVERDSIKARDDDFRERDASQITPMPARIERTRMRDSRKFKALILAVGVLFVPLLLTYSLCLKGMAKFSDLMDLAKWMGGALAPVFAAYIGSVAYEKNKTS
jgi:hypothetical protein